MATEMTGSRPIIHLVEIKDGGDFSAVRARRAFFDERLALEWAAAEISRVKKRMITKEPDVDAVFLDQIYSDTQAIELGLDRWDAR